MQHDEQLKVNYYDGRQYRPFEAVLRASHDGIDVHYAGKIQHYKCGELSYIAAIGDVLPAIELPDDARIEFLNHHVPDWLPLKNKRLLKHVIRMEQSWKWLIASVVCIALSVFSVVKWGVPYAAYHVAYALPENTLQDLGDKSEQQILKMTAPSTLEKVQQDTLKTMYQQQIASQLPKNQQPAKIIFRKGNRIGANALAIPNNTIVLTDELVKLAKNNQELMGVMAHEQGHLIKRHSLQQAIQGLGLSALYVAVTGDLSSTMTTLPLILVQLNYSRKFELEADRYAINNMKNQQISPQYLADFLTRLEEQYLDKDKPKDEQKSALGNIFQTHPATEDRIAQIKQHLN